MKLTTINDEQQKHIEQTTARNKPTISKTTRDRTASSKQMTKHSTTFTTTCTTMFIILLFLNDKPKNNP